MLGHLGTFAGLGQQPGDVEIGLMSRLVVDFAAPRQRSWPDRGPSGRAIRPPARSGFGRSERRLPLAASRCGPAGAACSCGRVAPWRPPPNPGALSSLAPSGWDPIPVAPRQELPVMLADDALAVAAFWDQALFDKPVLYLGFQQGFAVEGRVARLVGKAARGLI